MSERIPKNVALCSATYSAQQVPGSVIIVATGYHLTSGFQVFFEKSKIDVFPPEFTLWHVAPSGLVAQMVTPFSTYTSFSAHEAIERVIIHDEQGRHEIHITPVPDLLEHFKIATKREANGGGGGGGPEPSPRPGPTPKKRHA